MACIHICFLLLVELLVHVIKVDAKISAILVFGDSIVDAGNNNYAKTVMRANNPPYGRDFPGGKATGRFSNGRVSTDILSEAFGLKPTIPAYLDPAYNITDFSTGVCFASAGTGLDNATAHVFNVIPMWQEVEFYKEYQKRLTDAFGKQKAQEIVTDALHVISVGTNDWLENYFVVPLRRKQYRIRPYQDYLIGLAKDFITKIYNLGARKIVMYGLTAIGCTPIERAQKMLIGGRCFALYNNIAKEFNTKLERLFKQLNSQLPGAQIVMTNTYDGLWDMVQNPQKFGFEHTEFACCGTEAFEMAYLCNKANPLTCPDANKFIFWDGVHPTEHTNRVLIGMALNNSLSVFR